MTILAAIRFVDAPLVVEGAAAINRRLKEPLHLVHVLPAELDRIPSDAAQTFVRGCLEAQARRVRSDRLPVSVEVASGVAGAHVPVLVARPAE
jgi:hypothetical protein